MKKEEIEKIILSYKQTLNDEHLYQKTRSVYWQERYKNKEKFLSVENLENFRKDRVLSEHRDEDILISQGKMHLIEALDYFDGGYLKRTLPEKNVGKSNYLVNFMGYYFDYAIIHYLKWFEKIENYILPNFYILEIGGGFGSLARIIIKNKNVKYFLVDLPEANLLVNYYLQSHFPEKKIFNYSNYKISSIEKEIDKYDIFILPPSVLNNHNIMFDLAINSRSFMEMNKKVISDYFDLIQKKVKLNGYFLNINRYMKNCVGEKIRIAEYPYDKFWKVLISEKSFLQNHIHFLFTQRTNDEGNIVNELKNISILAKTYDYDENKYKSTILRFRHILKGYVYRILKVTLILFLGKRKLKKLSKIIYNFSI